MVKIKEKKRENRKAKIKPNKQKRITKDVSHKTTDKLFRQLKKDGKYNKNCKKKKFI